MRRVFLLMTVLAASLAAADLTGRWTGTVEFKGADGEAGGACLELKQQGDEITGKAGPNEEDLHPISNAKFDGKRLTFQVTGPQGQVFKLALELVADDKLEGTIDGQNEAGDKMTGKLAVKKTP